MPNPFTTTSFGTALLLTWIVLFSGLTTELTAQDTTGQLSVDEYSLKAAFLYNLAKFLDWPPDKFARADSPVIIGVEGPEACEKFSAMVGGKMIARHMVLVRLIKTDADIRECHILFITRSESESTGEICNVANKAAVLIVGETDKFLDSGGMIRFYLEADNLRLEIDNEAIRRQGLNIKANALSTLINKGIAKLRKI
jgi:hypothetical protein